MPVIMAAAQPTPGVTLKAAAGQFRAQAPHSMQAALSVMTAFLSTMVNTPWGQTSIQAPQPVQAVASRARLAPFFR